MLISGGEIEQHLKARNIVPRGVFHVGAHKAQELAEYETDLHISRDNIVWVEGNIVFVEKLRARGIPNVIHALVGKASQDSVTFNLASNGQSSSVLRLGTHAQRYPNITYTETVTLPMTTIDDLVNQHGIDPRQHNIWNLDIQGTELDALEGGQQALRHADAIYLEVNTEQVYEGCPELPEVDVRLASWGFQRVATTVKHIRKHGWGDALYVRVRH